MYAGENTYLSTCAEVCVWYAHLWACLSHSLLLQVSLALYPFLQLSCLKLGAKLLFSA